MIRLRSGLKVGEVHRLAWILLGEACEIDRTVVAEYDKCRRCVVTDPTASTWMSRGEPHAARITGSTFIPLGEWAAGRGEVRTSHQDSDPVPARLKSYGYKVVPVLLVRLFPGGREHKVLPQDVRLAYEPSFSRYVLPDWATVEKEDSCTAS